MASREYDILERQLIGAGAPAQTSAPGGLSGTITGPVAVLVNSKLSAKPCEDLLIAALPRLQGTERDRVVRALSERGMRKAAPILARMMANRAEAPEQGDTWAIGNALAGIRDPRTFETVITLCGDRRLGMGRQMLFSLLPRIGSEAAYRVALAALDDPSVRGHAIEAVGRFGRPEALDRLRTLSTQKGLYEDKVKATAIRRLERASQRPGE